MGERERQCREWGGVRNTGNRPGNLWIDSRRRKGARVHTPRRESSVHQEQQVWFVGVASWGGLAGLVRG